jgi:hypothetical protein
MTEQRTLEPSTTDADAVVDRDGNEPMTDATNDPTSIEATSPTPATAAPPSRAAVAAPAAAASTQAIADMGSGPAVAPPASAGPATKAAATPLFDETATGQLRDRWSDVQTGFVDEPRSAVEHADALVAEVMQRLAKGFATERQHLEEQWSRGDDVSTEDLRLALQRYRSFFDRLLSI